MKYLNYILLLLFSFSPLSFINSQSVNKDSFIELFNNKVLEAKSNITIQQILNFPKYNKEELYNRAKLYLDYRIQNKIAKTSTNTDYSYTNYSLIVTEIVDAAIVEKTFATLVYSPVEYVYKLEIKDYKVRATIYAHKINVYNSWLYFKDCFPITNKHKGMMKRLLPQFLDYTDKLFADTKAGIEKDYSSVNSNDEW